MHSAGAYTGATVKHRSAAGEELIVRHGVGTYVYPGGSMSYTGDWVAGVKHGRGVFTVGAEGSAAHSVYDGQFAHGEITGDGVKTFADGSVVRGSFLRGDVHGSAEWSAPSGARFEGSYRHNRRHGPGSLLSSAGTLYRGSFLSGKRHGAGVTTWSTGAVLSGAHEFDLLCGQGAESHADGSGYTGSFALGLRSGQGTYTHAASGVRIEGQWERGRPVHGGGGGRAVSGVQTLRVRVPRPPAAARDTDLVESLSSELASASLSASASSGGSKRNSSSVPPSPALQPTKPPTPTNKSKSKTAGGGGKKGAEEARLLADEAEAAYLATLSTGTVLLPSGAGQAVVDHGPREVVWEPGRRVDTDLFLCVCAGGAGGSSAVAASAASSAAEDNDVCLGESGRVLRVVLREAAVIASPEPAADQRVSSARGKKDAPSPSSALSAAEQLEPPEPLCLAFCACAGARTVPWIPKPKESEDDSVLAAVVSEEREKRGSGKKKKIASSPSSAKGKRHSAIAPVDAPPPPFVCDGRCATPANKSEWLTSLTLTTAGGYALLSDIWLSGSCTPGQHMELVVEDVTPGLPDASEAALTSPIVSPRHRAAAAAWTDELPPAPKPLVIARCAPSVIRILTAGAAPKQKKKLGAKKGEAKRASASAADA